MLPSLSATKPWGPESRVFSGYSLNSPVFGSSRPSLFAPWPVYQSEPSGASAGSCGRDRGVGTSYSWICTFRVPPVANPATVAANTNQYSLRRDMGLSLRENCSLSSLFFPSLDRLDELFLHSAGSRCLALRHLAAHLRAGMGGNGPLSKNCPKKNTGEIDAMCCAGRRCSVPGCLRRKRGTSHNGWHAARHLRRHGHGRIARISAAFRNSDACGAVT